MPLLVPATAPLHLTVASASPPTNPLLRGTHAAATKKLYQTRKVFRLFASPVGTVAAEREIAELQAAEKQRKLEEVLASREYQLWSQSLRVQQARQMNQEARQIMNYENAVSSESGVENLTQLRQAGERMVAGKALLQDAFAAYRELGGTAATAAEVEIGPDPAEPYR